ncbi:MAG TPA: fused MFS/spermidine synthase [Verrucomicrobiae bacterium]|nr:fused MFS/spermidine synthase [Verrucomicrobiae bacterium]
MAPIVFLASFCLMLVQIVAGRALAPFVGTSVYAWTGVIGATLAGLIFGSAAGGYLADRDASRKSLGQVLMCAGVATLLSNLVILLTGEYIAGSMPLVMRVWLMSIGAFFPAAYFLAMVSPLAARLSVHELGDAGRIVGRLSAIGAVGNIAGVLLAAYVLIPVIGTKALLTGVAVGLICLGIGVASGHALWKNRLMFLVLLFLVADLFLPRVCQTETAYYCIRVIETRNTAGAPVEILRLDHLVHSYVNQVDPRDLGYGYEREYANLISNRAVTSTAFSALFIGGGGYVLPRYIEAEYPHATSVVAEIDPGVTAFNHASLGLSSTTTIMTRNEDARQYVLRGGDPPFDFVFGDAFNDFSVPTHLTTVEFQRLLKSRMKPDGIYALNIIDDARYGKFLAAMIRTLSAVWKHVEVDTQAPTIIAGRNTVVLFASDDPIPTSTLEFVSHEEVEAFLKDHVTPILTDDFAPTDRYLAPVFKDAY